MWKINKILFQNINGKYFIFLFFHIFGKINIIKYRTWLIGFHTDNNAVYQYDNHDKKFKLFAVHKIVQRGFKMRFHLLKNSEKNILDFSEWKNFLMHLERTYVLVYNMNKRKTRSGKGGFSVRLSEREKWLKVFWKSWKDDFSICLVRTKNRQRENKKSLNEH